MKIIFMVVAVMLTTTLIGGEKETDNILKYAAEIGE
jgi:hypothetical protein